MIWLLSHSIGTEFVLVVGECLAANDDKLLSKEYMENHPRSMNVSIFRQHETCASRHDGIWFHFVTPRRQCSKKGILYSPNRQGGLCRLKSPAQVKTHGNHKKCYWYSDFSFGDPDIARERQSTNIILYPTSVKMKRTHSCKFYLNSLAGHGMLVLLAGWIGHSSCKVLSNLVAQLNL